MSDKLTPKQSEFVRQYLLTRNATEAARLAGYKGNDVTLAQTGSQLVRNPHIATILKGHQLVAVQKFEVTLERIVRELSAIAFGSMGDIFEWDSVDAKFIAKKDLTEDQMKYIDSITAQESYQKVPTEDGFEWLPIKKFKVATLAREKVRALEVLTKIMGFDKPEGGVDAIADSFKAAMDDIRNKPK